MLTPLPSFEHILSSFPNWVMTFLVDPDMTLAGAYVDSKIIHSHLPPTIKKKVKRRTIIRRVASKGFKPERKIAKNDPGPALMKKRLNFAKKYFVVRGGAKRCAQTLRHTANAKE